MLINVFFKSESIPFFGHVISREGIKPDPKKIEAVKTMTTPTSKLELQSFLGLCNYLAIYVPSLSACVTTIGVSLQRRTLIFNGTRSMTLCTSVPKITLWKIAKHCAIMIQTSQFQLKQMLVSQVSVLCCHRREDLFHSCQRL